MADAGNTALGSPRSDATAAASGGPHATLADARIDVRIAGYCAYCDRIVEREPDGRCPAGHPAEGLTGRLVLIDDEPMPRLPAFNWAAFLIPFIWGPAHDQWIGAVFLPIWLFADSIIGTAGKAGAVSTLAAAVVLALTLLFQRWFAKRANGLAFRRVIGSLPAEQFIRSQRRWAIASVPVATVLLAWAVWFRVAVAPTLVVR